MTAELVAAWAGAFAAFCAGAGLVFSGLQTMQATASRDFDTLQSIFDQMRGIEDKLLLAAKANNIAEWRALSVQLLNWVELLVVAHDRKLIGPISREFGKDMVLDVLAMLESSDALEHLKGQLIGQAYKHTRAFMRKNGVAIRERVDEMAAQDARNQAGGSDKNAVTKGDKID